MAPSKSNGKSDKSEPYGYGWCTNKKNLDNISLDNLKAVYRISQSCTNSSRNCKRDPCCLWGLGEKKWIRNTEETPEEDDQINRNEGQLAGIVNLGATCYVNSLLQLWFHNPILRPAILKWKPNNGESLQTEEYKPSCPISHLQAMFARMLLSKRITIDPTQFTTSLELNTGEQQDAQEFSNLLMTLLDRLLEQYQSREIQNLVKDSFTGSYAYETICASCQRGSMSFCDFRELGLIIKKDLKESLSDFLKDELLTNANQYNCGQCGKRSDARRETKITRLPPVLNLQLMRFIYDRETQTKKKNKLQISFPEILDMGEYLDSNLSGNVGTTENTYILNAVLTHKGRAAHHGHYIAHIRDMSNGDWFECNDDSVQPMKSSSKTLIIKNDEANNNTTSGDTNKKEYTSDGAYMLVYTRKSYLETSNKDVEIHEYLKNLVAEEDKEYEEEYLKTKISKDNEIKRKELRNEEINLLYRDLLPLITTTDGKKKDKVPLSSEQSTSSSNEKENLVKELASELASAYKSPQPQTPVPRVKRRHDSKDPASSLASNTDLPSKPANGKTCEEFDFLPNSFFPSFFEIKNNPKVENNTLTCPHGKLKPPAPNEVSVQYRVVPGYFAEVIFSRYEFDLRLSGPSALCVECVKSNCQMLKDLAILEEDSKRFLELTKVIELEADDLVWISNELQKTWRKEARLGIERTNEMLTNGGWSGDNEEEPLEKNSELRCDHGSLSPGAAKTMISYTAWTIIYKYFPTALTWWTHEKKECRECLKISESNSVVQQENKRIATDQKIRLNELYSDRHRPDIKEGRGDFYIIPTTFVQEWKKFIRDPTKMSYPILKIEELLCPHEQFMYPLHVMDDLIAEGVLNQSILTLITRAEWNILKEQVDPGAELKITVGQNSEVEYGNDVCSDCSIEWWTNQRKLIYIYEYGNIYIEKKEDINEVSQEVASQDNGDEFAPFAQPSGKRERREQPIRRSKRKCLAKNVKKYTDINSDMVIRDFQKTFLYCDFNAILSDQHLYHKGREFSEKEKGQTFRELEIQSNSTLVLIIDPPTTQDDSIDMEVDTTEPAKPENGFRGTVLQGGV